MRDSETEQKAARFPLHKMAEKTSLFFSASVTHVYTSHHSDNKLWHLNINKSFINLGLKYSQLKLVFRLPWTPDMMKLARIRH